MIWINTMLQGTKSIPCSRVLMKLWINFHGSSSQSFFFEQVALKYLTKRLPSLRNDFRTPHCTPWPASPSISKNKKKNPFGLVGEGASSSVKEGKKIKGGSHDLCCVEYIYGRRETERSLNKEWWRQRRSCMHEIKAEMNCRFLACGRPEQPSFYV